MPLGPNRCNGPSGYIDSTIPPPDPQVGRGFDFLLYIILYSYHVLAHSLLNLQYPICFTESIKYLFSHWFLSFGFVIHLFGYYTLVWSMNMAPSS
jgi:hypothetical protein